jgi:hypothetical protein
VIGFLVCLGRRAVEGISLFSVAAVSLTGKGPVIHGMAIGGHTALVMSDNIQR